MAATAGPASPTRSAASPRATTPQPFAARSGPAPLRRRRIKVERQPLLAIKNRRGPAWSGDETPWQLSAVFVNAATADSRGDLLRRFLRAYGNAIRDYRAAFTGPADRRKDNATAPETLAVIAKFIGFPVDQVALGIGYTDLRVDTSDILRQIAWYKSQGMVKPEVDGSKIIDTRYVIPLPDK